MARPGYFVRKVRVLDSHTLALEFEDGSSGEADVSDLIGRGVFDALRDPAVFHQARVDSSCGTVVWPGGLDVAPELLHRRAQARPGGERKSA